MKKLDAVLGFAVVVTLLSTLRTIIFFDCVVLGRLFALNSFGSSFPPSIQLLLFVQGTAVSDLNLFLSS